MKIILTSLFLICSLFCWSQQTDRIEVQGEIVVPKGDERDQISVYNVSSQKGTVTDAKGLFTLAVGVNDRVLISALQFQSFTVVVDKGVIEAKTMRVYMNPAVNQLDEIIVRPYDLSGNIAVDVKRLNVYESPNFDLSYKTLEYDYEFTQDRQSQVDGNAAEEALNNGGLQNGANFVSILGFLAQQIIPKKKKEKIVATPSYSTMVKALQQRYSAQYYYETFGIPLNRVDDFIYFVQESAVTPDLLKSENEIELLKVLFQQSEIYKERLKDE